MEAVIETYMTGLKLGEPQEVENLTVIPLFSDADPGPEYFTLSEALTDALLTVTELDAGGSVPELKVMNGSGNPVLLLDGEELAGAKQNRVLNTSVLVKEKSETVIPVSCTEQGRWHYTSDKFADSGTVLPRAVRSRKSRSVSRSLVASEGTSYRSDQGEVWEGVAQMAASADVSSPTGAMRDVYEARHKDLSDYTSGLELKEGQRGLLVLIDGKAAGLDVLSRPEAYARIHERLLKSYAMDALVRGAHRGGEKEGDREDPLAFLKQCMASEEKLYDSVGYGLDYRYHGREAVGSALVWDDTVVHMAFFRNEGDVHESQISEMSRRRGFRS